MTAIMAEPTNRPRVALTTGAMTPKDVASMRDNLTHEHYWAAGFIEGEGCITVSQGYIRIVAGQNFREPLERLQAVAGGRIYKQNYRDFYTWQIGAQAAVEDTLKWLAPLLSQRRQAQIEDAYKRRDDYLDSAERQKHKKQRADHAREKYRSDPEWRERRKAQQKAWIARNPNYKRDYDIRRRQEDANGA